MLVYNKTILLPNLYALYELLNNNDDESLYTCKCIYTDRIAIQHSYKKDMHSIRIWKSKSLFDYWFDDFHHSGRNFIASLDYIIHEQHIKIVYLSVNNGKHVNLYNKILDENEVDDVLEYLIKFVKIVARKENKTKIILDVHANLQLYNKYYYYEGFEKTDRKSVANPFWIETELNLPLV
jgi:hypothetical protein